MKLAEAETALKRVQEEDAAPSTTTARADGSAIRVALAEADLAEQLRRRKEEVRLEELQKVAVRAQDVAIVAREGDLDEKEARILLQECGGDLKRSLTKLVLM